MTAREDQPQLGTCKFWPLLQHAQDACCLDWKPAEDQPRPTPPHIDASGNCTECGAIHYGTGQVCSSSKFKAGGEAPQQHIEDVIGRLGDALGGDYAKGHMSDIEAIVEATRRLEEPFMCDTCLRVEAGAHPSQDAPRLRARDFDESDDSPARPNCHPRDLGYWYDWAEAYADAAGARSTPSPDPHDVNTCKDQHCGLCVVKALDDRAAPSPDPPTSRPYSDKWWSKHAELDKWSANLEHEVERLREALRERND